MEKRGHVVKRGGETMVGTTRSIRVYIKIRDATKINISKQKNPKLLGKPLA